MKTITLLWRKLSKLHKNTILRVTIILFLALVESSKIYSICIHHPLSLTRSFKDFVVVGTEPVLIFTKTKANKSKHWIHYSALSVEYEYWCNFCNSDYNVFDYSFSLYVDAVLVWWSCQKGCDSLKTLQVYYTESVLFIQVIVCFVYQRNIFWLENSIKLYYWHVVFSIVPREICNS